MLTNDCGCIYYVMIDTRQELIIALRHAAELEHGLMVQYLYAAMTLKPPSSSRITTAEQELIMRWRVSIYAVAREEMGHLGTVQNILAAVGGGTWFRLPAFPNQSKYFFPRQTFSLTPLNADTIERFVTFESPSVPVEAIERSHLAPDPIQYGTVGDLYNQIKHGMRKIGEDALFIGDRASQDIDNWSPNVELHAITSLQAALRAIDDIVEEGEGTERGGPESHYQRFLKIQTELQQEIEQFPAFMAHDDVVSNPTVFEDRSATRTLVTDSDSLAIAKLFDSTYTTMLFSLSQYYKFQEKPGVPVPGIDPGDFLRSNIAMGLMKGVLRPLGEEVLPRLHCCRESPGHAGPPFETYLDPVLPWGRTASWRILHERLLSEAAFAEKHEQVHHVLLRVKNALKLIARTVGELIGE